MSLHWVSLTCTSTGGLRCTDTGLLLSLWWALVGAGGRERRIGPGNRGGIDSCETLGGACGGCGGLIGVGGVGWGGGGCESRNFLRVLSRSSLTSVRIFWIISSRLTGGEVWGHTSGCAFGSGGSDGARTCGEGADDGGWGVGCCRNCWSWWIWDAAWVASCWLSRAFCCCKAEIWAWDCVCGWNWGSLPQNVQLCHEQEGRDLPLDSTLTASFGQGYRLVYPSILEWVKEMGTWLNSRCQVKPSNHQMHPRFNAGSPMSSGIMVKVSRQPYGQLKCSTCELVHNWTVPTTKRKWYHTWKHILCLSSREAWWKWQRSVCRAALKKGRLAQLTTTDLWSSKKGESPNSGQQFNTQSTDGRKAEKGRLLHFT